MFVLIDKYFDKQAWAEEFQPLNFCSFAALAGEFHCGFEDGNICLFTQDDTDNFDWTKQSTATRDTKYTPNTGPNADRTGSKEGKLQWWDCSLGSGSSAAALG